MVLLLSDKTWRENIKKYYRYDEKKNQQTKHSRVVNCFRKFLLFGFLMKIFCEDFVKNSRGEKKKKRNKNCNLKNKQLFYSQWDESIAAYNIGNKCFPTISFISFSHSLHFLFFFSSSYHNQKCRNGFLLYYFSLFFRIKRFSQALLLAFCLLFT
jgi:hypothetical protein